jgi:hypothetical protein
MSAATVRYLQASVRHLQRRNPLAGPTTSPYSLALDTRRPQLESESDRLEHRLSAHSQPRPTRRPTPPRRRLLRCPRFVAIDARGLPRVLDLASEAGLEMVTVVGAT